MSCKILKSPLVNRLILNARAFSTGLDVGTAGSIRAAGGALGKLEAAREQDYFIRKQHEQLKKLKNNQISMEIFHQKQIVDLEEALNAHRDSLKKLRSP